MSTGEEKKLGFIGDPSSIEFFKIFGADVFPAYTSSEAEELLAGGRLSGYALIFITEEVFSSNTMNRYLMGKKIMVIPSLVQNREQGYAIITTLIGKATGMKEDGAEK